MLRKAAIVETLFLLQMHYPQKAKKSITHAKSS